MDIAGWVRSFWRPLTMAPKSSRRAFFVLVLWIALICLSIAFVDRAASTFSYTHFQRPIVMVWLTHLVDPLEPLAIIGLALAGLAALASDWRPGERGRGVLAACIAILVSVATKEELKYFFGRTWPETWINNNPSWIQNHVHGFFILHGGQGWASFPSGHTTQMAALATVLWLVYPRLRWLAVTLVAAVAIGLWGSDFHFIGDILAGALIGAASGAGSIALMCRRAPAVEAQ